MKSHIAPLALVVGLLLLAAGLAVMVQPQQGSTVTGLQSFNSYSELNSFLDRNSANKGPVYAPIADQSASAGTSIDDHSTTNVQVSGVQEEDRVLTDGIYIYSAGQEIVSIINALPASTMGNVSSINMSQLLSADDKKSSTYIEGIYLSEGKLVVVCQESTYSLGNQVYALDTVAFSYRSSSTRTTASIFDVTSPAAPRLVQTVGISGSFTTSRVQGDNLYLFSTQYAWDSSVGGPVVPTMNKGSTDAQLEPGQILYDPGMITVSCFLNLIRLDLADLGSQEMSFLTGYSSVMYVSESNIYVTYPHYNYYGSIYAVQGDVTVSSTSWSSSYTTIYWIDISSASMVLEASGTVRGNVIDRYAMDEKDGNLRIATTDSNTTTETLVSVLSSDLTLMGQVGGIGIGEAMQSSRYIGDTLYLVTYRQVDPLFAIDLSDPSTPHILGELTIPGFSTYLHPVDATHLIGLGFEGHSMKVSLYNVSDPTHPVEEQKLLLSNFSYSPALYDPHAVTYDASRSLLVVPVSDPTNSGYWYNCAAYLFNTSGGISLVGTAGSNNSGGVDRTLYIGDNLYVCSQYSISAYGIDGLAFRGAIVLGNAQQYWYGYGGISADPIPMSLGIK